MWRLAKPSFLWRFLIYRNFEEKVCRWCNGGWGASVFCDEVLICSTHGVVGGDGLLKVTFPWGGMSHVKEQQKSLRLPLGAEISFFWKKKMLFLLLEASSLIFRQCLAGVFKMSSLFIHWRLLLCFAVIFNIRWYSIAYSTTTTLIYFTTTTTQ